jgi:hypothetical protein
MERRSSTYRAHLMDDQLWHRIRAARAHIVQ